MKKQKNKIVELSDEEARSMAAAPLENALLTFVGLVEWRSNSGSSSPGHIPYWARREAEKMKCDPNYRPHLQLLY